MEDQMSVNSDAVSSEEHAPSVARSGVWSWITTTDHKRIGILYGISAFFFFLVGGLEALLIRLQLASANNDLVSAETFLAMWEGLIRAALPDGDGLVTIFTNHSLPVHIRKWDDPYESDFRATASALADRCGLGDWDCAFQSVGGGGGGATEWLGPDLPEILRKWKDKGHGNFLLVPIGFLNAHLEVSYDIDIDLQATAKNMAVTVTRTDMPDDNPLFIQTLADRVMGVVGDQSSVMTA